MFAAGLALALIKDTLALAARPITVAAFWLGAGLATLSVVPSLRKRHAILPVVLLSALLVVDLVANNGPNESTALPPDFYDMLRPNSRNELINELDSRLSSDPLARVELAGLGFAWPNATIVHRFHNVLGYNPVRLRIYSEATGAEDHVALPEQRRFSPLMPSYRSRLADLLGLRFIVTGVPVERIDSSLNPGDLTFVGQIVGGFLYENPRARPRVEFAARAVAADQDELLRTGRWPEGDLTGAVVLDQAPASVLDQASGQGRASITRYDNTDVEVEVDAETAGYVVLRDPYHRWWRAAVDGAPAPILRADGIFRAVPVSAGRHRLRFTFQPWQGAWRDLATRWLLLSRLDFLLPSLGQGAGTPL
jgi:hypothetical protein